MNANVTAGSAVNAADRTEYAWAQLDRMTKKQRAWFEALHALFPKARLSCLNEDFLDDRETDMGLGVEVSLHQAGVELHHVQFYGNGHLYFYDRHGTELFTFRL